MTTELLGIFCGQRFATAAGDELTVCSLNPKAGYAVIQTLNDEQGVMDLGAMLQAIQTGSLVNIDQRAESDDELD